MGDGAVVHDADTAIGVALAEGDAFGDAVVAVVVGAELPGEVEGAGVGMVVEGDVTGAQEPLGSSAGGAGGADVVEEGIEATEGGAGVGIGGVAGPDGRQEVAALCGIVMIPGVDIGFDEVGQGFHSTLPVTPHRRAASQANPVLEIA